MHRSTHNRAAPRPGSTLGVLLVAVAFAVAGLPAEALARGTQPVPIHPASELALGSPGAPIRDRVLPKRPHRRAHAAASVDGSGRGGDYTVTVNGKVSTVRVYLSKAFTSLDSVADKAAIDSLNRGWAEEFAKMPHGPELASLTVYIAPYAEISSDEVCTSAADSCYDPNDGSMYLTGDTPPDGAGILQIAMHEYGHHVATNRLNTPWDALGWGPKYWASAQGVCTWVRKGKMFPFDEGSHYEDNPSEVWAETYRIVAAKAAGLTPDPWEILNPDWNPESSEPLLAAAERDVSNPWTPAKGIPNGVRTTRRGSLGPRGHQSTTVSIPNSLDGKIESRIATTGGLRVAVRLTPRGGAIRHGNVCGASRVDATVTRRSGSGTWSLFVRHPGT